VAEIRNILEQALSAYGFKTISVGNGAGNNGLAQNSLARLPNTLCIIAEGWKGETQVMGMDLAGFAVSAGSACSSGKVRASRTLQAMGFDAVQSASALRISIGPGITREDVLRFADAWAREYGRIQARRA
ncbi:MAG: aminotransferase, partial [Cypionkella sp.]